VESAARDPRAIKSSTDAENDQCTGQGNTHKLNAVNLQSNPVQQMGDG
jgi:hypothetical protein